MRAQSVPALDTTAVRVATYDSGRPGPCVVVLAGGRPDQRFPLHALSQIGGWSLSTGRMVTMGIALPAIPAGLAEQLAACQPDWILELREDFYFPRAGLATLGGSLIHSKQPAVQPVAAAILAAINAGQSHAQSHFQARPGSATRSSFALNWAAQHNVQAALLVTSARQNTTPTRDLRAAVRIRQQRLGVHALLRQLQMIDATIQVDQFVDPQRAKSKAQDKLVVGIYDGPGSGRPMPFVTDLMNGLAGLEAHPIHPVEIQSGGLASFDVVVFPGGMASHQFDALAERGRRAVQEFVRGGGGYIGICAGAYMAANQPYQWGLGLLAARIVDHDHWARGIGTVQIELTPSGRRVFGGRSGRFDYHYGNGPIFAPAANKDLAEYEVLAWYRTGIGVDGADPQVMVNTPAILSGMYGKGRVLVSSGHSEWSSGIEAFLLRYVEWAAGRPHTPRASR
ncbi:MAG: BPL-N domain-containing protein [Planctomycetota bacterium]|nr:BPL-N domain-containing protein [Planctomycetota bacterium]